MSKQKKKVLVLAVVLAVLLIALLCLFFLRREKRSVFARTAAIQQLIGDTRAYRGQEETDIYVGQKLLDGDSLETGQASNIYLNIDSDKTVKLCEDSHMDILAVSSKQIKLALSYGSFHFNVENKLPAGEVMEFAAGSTVMSVRGTMGHGSYDQTSDKLEFFVYSGEVAAVLESGETVSVTAGTKLLVESGTA